MRAFKFLLSALLGSVVLYGVVFGLVLKRPLTLGFIKEAYDLKMDYVNAHSQQKLLILSGSNGLFSFRCETIEKIIGMPCVNASVTVAIGPKLIFDKGRKMARPGDIILMPLEYQEYLLSGNALPLAYLASYEPRYLADLDAATRLRAFFSFNFSYFIFGVAETSLKYLGVERRISARSLTPNGDFKGHTEAVAQLFRASIGPAPIPQAVDFDGTSVSWQIISEFLEWAKANKVHVVGMLPTTVDLVPVTEEMKAKISELYKSKGHDFLSLPNFNQFPLECFYDSYYHLHEGCQTRFSENLAALLSGVISRQQ